MGKTSKFSFPFSARNKRGEEVNRAEQVRVQQNKSALIPESPAPSKAERILGETVSFRHLTFLPSLRASPAQSAPSASLVTSGTSPNKLSTLRAVKEYNSTPEDAKLSTIPSLALPRSGSDAGSIARSDRRMCGSPLHHKVSSSTMHSFYDPHSSPLSISQQTSESSARDMALRKGQPTVTQRFAAAESEISSKPSEVSREKAATLRKVRTKKKPTVLDMTKLFPTPVARGGALLSPNKLVNSPSRLSDMSEYSSTEPTKQVEPQLMSDAGVLNPDLVHQSLSKYAPPQRVPLPKQQDSHKVHVRKPPGGIQHWFDSLEMEDDDLEPDLESHALLAVAAEQAKVKRRSVSDPLRRNPIEADDLDIDQRARVAAARCVPTPVLEQYARDRRLSVLSNHSAVSRKTGNSIRSRMGRLAEANLEEASVLCISSSEDDDSDDETPELSDGPSVSDACGSEDTPATLGQELSMPCSGLFPDLGKEGMMYKATVCVMPQSPPATCGSTSLPESDPSRGIAGTHTRSRSMNSIKLVANLQPIRPEPKITAARPSEKEVDSSSPPKSESRTSNPQSRVMAVSKEEEALLGMMRSKRATMKQQLFSEGYQQALKEELNSAHRHPVKDQNNHSSQSQHPERLSADSFPSPPKSLPPSPPVERRHRTSSRNYARPQTSPKVLSRPEGRDLQKCNTSVPEAAPPSHGFVHPASRIASPSHLLSPLSTCSSVTSDIFNSLSSSLPPNSQSSTPVAPTFPVPNPHSHRHVSFQAEPDRASRSHQRDESKTSSIIVLDVSNAPTNAPRAATKRPLYGLRMDSVQEDILLAWADLGGFTGHQVNGTTRLY